MGKDYSPKRGDVVMADLGVPPVAIVGHEQAKDRPCLVIYTFPSMKLAWIVPCTSKPGIAGLPSVVRVDKGTAGLTVDSFVLCHQLRSISTDRIRKYLGTMPELEFGKVLAVLNDIIGYDQA